MYKLQVLRWDADILQRYEQIRRKVAKQLSICIKFLQAQKAGTPKRGLSASISNCWARRIRK